jgi:hypothetical protein
MTSPTPAGEKDWMKDRAANIAAQVICASNADGAIHAITNALQEVDRAAEERGLERAAAVVESEPDYPGMTDEWALSSWERLLNQREQIEPGADHRGAVYRTAIQTSSFKTRESILDRIRSLKSTRGGGNGE